MISLTEMHVVVAALLCRGDQVLLCHRSPHRAWYPDVWDLPGGHVQQDEDAAAALRRELVEELGVDVGVIPSDPDARLRRTGEDLSVWRIHRWAGAPTNLAPTEHDRIGWFTPDQALALPLADPAHSALVRQLSARSGS